MAFIQSQGNQQGNNLSLRTLCEQIVEIQEKKQDGYSTSPIDELPLPVWLAQVQIKATRAKYATSVEKMRDELIDTAVYALLCILKLNKDSCVLKLNQEKQ